MDILCFTHCLLNFTSNLSILSSANGTIEIEGLMDMPMSDAKQAYQWYGRGKHARSTSWTNVNDASSRSHWSVTWLVHVNQCLMLNLVSNYVIYLSFVCVA